MIRGIIGGLLYPNVQVFVSGVDSVRLGQSSADSGRIDIKLRALGINIGLVVRDKRRFPYVTGNCDEMQHKIGKASFRAWEVTVWAPGPSRNDDGD